MQSVVVCGGGIVGSAIGFALARAGVRVTILERNVRPSEEPGETGVASWAAAGILGAQIAASADGPLLRLCLASRAVFPSWVAEIEALTGHSVELRGSGVMRPALDHDELERFASEVAWQLPLGLRVEHLDGPEACALEPSLAASVVGAVRFPDDARIDPPALLRALRAAVVACSGEIRYGAAVRRLVLKGARCRGVELADGVMVSSDAVVVAVGSWLQSLEGLPPSIGVVKPCRGQMVELLAPQGTVRGVLDGSAAYLSPREDGRVLVGATVEFVGHELATTVASVVDLLSGALRLVPSLSGARFTRTWAGFRPYSEAPVPRLGPTEIPGLFVASGHHRNGVLLSPITATILAAQITEKDMPIDVAPYSPISVGASS